MANFFQKILHRMAPPPPTPAVRSKSFSPVFGNMKWHGVPNKSALFSKDAAALTKMEALYSAYLDTPHMAGVLKNMARAFSRIKFTELNARGNPKDKSEIISLLNKPNPVQARGEFLEALYINFKLFGNSYWLSNHDKPNMATKLYVPHPPYVKIQTTGKMFNQTKLEDIVKGYYIGEDGVTSLESKWAKPSRVLHLVDTSARLLRDSDNDSPIYGEAALSSNMLAIEALLGVHDTRKNLIWRRGAQMLLSNNMAGALEGADYLAPDEKKELLDRLSLNYGTTSGQSSIMITNSNLKAQNLVLPIKDLMLDENQFASLSAICDALGYPVGLLANRSSGAFDNGGQRWEMERWMYENTIIPDAQHFAAEIGRWFGGVEIGVDTSEIGVLEDNEGQKASNAKATADAMLARLAALEKGLSLGLDRATLEAELGFGTST